MIGLSAVEPVTRKTAGLGRRIYLELRVRVLGFMGFRVLSCLEALGIFPQGLGL